MAFDRQTLPDYSSASVLIIGDVMLDRYWYGATSRISPEAPVPVVHVQDIEERPGGAGNVAINIAALNARVNLVGVTGDDDAADSLSQLLAARNVHCHFECVPQRATSTKLRVLSRHQQLIRLDFEDPAEGGALSQLNSDLLNDAGAVVISDYGKGALKDITQIITQARALNIPVLIDPKGSDFSPYKGATLITPNLSEFEAVVGACHDLEDLVSRAENLCKQLEIGGLLVTRSEHGMSLIRPDEPPVHLPTHAREVYDVTGAGDTVIGVMAASIASGKSLSSAMALANHAAGIVVGKLGTASVNSSELNAALNRHELPSGGVLSEEELIEQVKQTKRQGSKVVMTNGCFDILHAGHVRYLNHARSLGDKLIVAVNDDASVKRLKGHERPINPLARRMAVLEALACVDWVVPFSEETPERLICEVTPDLLIKGGDYKPEEIAGGDCVKKQGGDVIVLDYEEGCSTTEILDALSRSTQHNKGDS